MSVDLARKWSWKARAGRNLRAHWRRIAHLAPKVAFEWLRADGEQKALWAPVMIGLGVGIYFSLKTEPPIFATIFAILVAGGLWLTPLRRYRSVAAAICLAVLGFAAADWRSERVGAPILERALSIRPVSGRIIAIEEGVDARRYLLALHEIDRLSADMTPARARISWRGQGGQGEPGDVVSLRAGLGPPPPPATPGGFDFARQLYFQRIGAVGFAVSAPQILPGHPLGYGDRLRAHLEGLREKIFRRITTSAQSEGGAIVAAIVTGKREAITPQSEAALRDTGLAHLLAISGLHMGLATGLIFVAIRAGLAVAPFIALRFPIKKWAACAAILSGVFYLVLSGGGWSARRAFIMTAVIFAAVLIDRRALSLRNVALAATIILLTTPESLIHPGFQMSFAAVTGLIAGYEWARRRNFFAQDGTLRTRFKQYVVGLAFTDSVAALATAPYALYHFNRVALYSLPANMIAMPVMAFWVIPSAIMALMLAPFGLDGWVWRVSASGMETILRVAHEVAGWRGAVSLTPQWPLSAMIALSLGGLWLCLGRSPLRLAGIAAIPLAALLIARDAPPDLFVAASGLNAGVVVDEGGPSLAVYTRRRDRFAAGVWKEAAGLDPAHAPLRRMDEIGHCDAAGCVMTLGKQEGWGQDGRGLQASFIKKDAALAEDCARADIVVAFFPADGADWSACPAILIDRRSVWRRGAHAVWIDSYGRMRIETAADARGDRPWTAPGHANW